MEHRRNVNNHVVMRVCVFVFLMAETPKPFFHDPRGCSTERNWYKLERQDRNSRGGGIAAFIRAEIPARRRRDLESKNIENILFEGLKFKVVPSNFEENLCKESFSSPLDYVAETAKQKTLEVVHRLYASEVPPPDLIIGADTVVTLGKEIFEKPKSRGHAVEVLTRLSGSSHEVITSVVLVTPSHAEPKYSLVQFHSQTEVFMGDLSPRVIEAYVDTGEPMDKAGGYGIQALGSTLIQQVNGDYFNVIGFPLHPFAKEVLRLFPE